MMQLHLVPSPSGTSSTRTRCETLAIIPRISGLSSLTTESCRRCRPSRLTVAFWSFGRSMQLRISVTLSFATALLQAGLSPLGRHGDLCVRASFDHGPRGALLDV